MDPYERGVGMVEWLIVVVCCVLYFVLCVLCFVLWWRGKQCCVCSFLCQVFVGPVNSFVRFVCVLVFVGACVYATFSGRICVLSVKRSVRRSLMRAVGLCYSM